MCLKIFKKDSERCFLEKSQCKESIMQFKLYSPLIYILVWSLNVTIKNVAMQVKDTLWVESTSILLNLKTKNVVIQV